MTPMLIARGIPDLLPMARTGDPVDHISHVIRSLCVRLGHFTIDEDVSKEAKAQIQTRMEMGSAFEDALIVALIERYRKSDPDRFVHAGELTKDGLIGTMDLLDATDWAVLEVKLTWISSRHGPDSEKFWKYWVQLKAYCHMAGTNLGRLHVCHINGNYKGDRGPTYNVWEDRFSKQELEENWLMLTRHHAELHKEAQRARRVGRKS